MIDGQPAAPLQLAAHGARPAPRCTAAPSSSPARKRCAGCAARSRAPRRSSRRRACASARFSSMNTLIRSRSTERRSGSTRAACSTRARWTSSAMRCAGFGILQLAGVRCLRLAPIASQATRPRPVEPRRRRTRVVQLPAALQHRLPRGSISTWISTGSGEGDDIGLGRVVQAPVAGPGARRPSCSNSERPTLHNELQVSRVADAAAARTYAVARDAPGVDAAPRPARYA